MTRSGLITTFTRTCGSLGTFESHWSCVYDNRIRIAGWTLTELELSSNIVVYTSLLGHLSPTVWIVSPSISPLHIGLDVILFTRTITTDERLRFHPSSAWSSNIALSIVAGAGRNQRLLLAWASIWSTCHNHRQDQIGISQVPSSSTMLPELEQGMLAEALSG